MALYKKKSTVVLHSIDLPMLFSLNYLILLNNQLFMEFDSAWFFL